MLYNSNGTKLVDVKGDGSCFYRSLYVVLKSRRLHNKFLKRICGKEYSKASTEEEFVIQIREGLSNLILENKDEDEIKSIFNHLHELETRDYKEILNSSFPTWFQHAFQKLPKSERNFRKKFATGIRSMDSWASEIDIRIISKYLSKDLHMDLMILNNIPSSKQTFKPNAVYLLNRSELHYNAIIPKANRRPIPIRPSPNTSRPKTSKSSAECKPTHILNPKTKRCVKKTSCKGYEVLANQYYKQTT